MPSKLNVYLLSAVMLAALLLCAQGAPAENVPTDNPAEDSSGEEAEGAEGAEGAPDLLSDSPVLKAALDITARHNNDFAAEFQNAVPYRFLDDYKISSIPVRCPVSNFSKEACLQRLVEGLQTYSVLLKFVEKEYPTNTIVSETITLTNRLINVTKDKMKNPHRLRVLTSNQEKQLLKSINPRDTYSRKMTAHSILRELHWFLLDCKRAIFNKEKLNRSVGKKSVSSLHLHYQNR